MFPGKEITMNLTTQAILAMLELMWQDAHEDANQDLDHADLTEVDQAITRMETIADVIDAIKKLTGGDRG